MEWRYTISACLLILVTLMSLVNSLEDDKELELDFTDVDHSKYVDPFDMINYNRNSLSEADELNNQENPFEILPRPLTQHEEITKNFVVEDMIESPVVMKHLSHLQKNLGSLKHCGLGKGGDWEKPFLLRFVLILSNLLTIKDRIISEGENLEIPLVAVLTKQSKFVIEDILMLGEHVPPSKFADLDEVLSSMFKLDEQRCLHHKEGSLVQRLVESVNFHPKDWLVMMYLFCIFYAFKLVLCGHSLRSIIIRSLTPLLVTSWYWHWHHLDQQASAKRQSDLVKASKLPAACNPETLDTWSSIKLFVSTTFLRNADPCEEYHKALLTDPSFEVNPFLALTDMLAISIFNPLRYVGEQTGGFFDGVLSSTNFFTMIPVFLAVLVVILVGFFMMFGYELHTPLFKITSKKALTSVQFESAVQTQVLLDNHAFQALQTHRMAELGVLERANLAVPRIQPIVLEDLSTRIKDKELPQKEIGDQTLSTKKQEASVDSGLCSRQEHTSVGSRDETQDDQQRSNTERPEIENLSNEAPKETAIVNS